MIKRILGAALVLAAVWGLPRLSHPAVDIGKLEPVEAVRLTAMENGIRVETDTGAKGMGRTLEEAVADLRKGTAGEVFLETADKLLISGDLTEFWNEIFALFRPACQVYLTEDEVDLNEAAEYLDTHPSGQTLGRLRGGLGELPVLKMQEGRGQLVTK